LADGKQKYDRVRRYVSNGLGGRKATLEALNNVNIETTTALQICKMDKQTQCVPYTTNCRNITKTMKILITGTPTGSASYATSPMKAMSEMEDTSTQKVGIREDRQKKT
jgi:hypothetical protein